MMRCYHHENQGVGVEISDRDEELYYGIDIINVREDEGPSQVETYAAYPLRHVNKRNAETYFHRPGDLF